MKNFKNLFVCLFCLILFIISYQELQKDDFSNDSFSSNQNSSLLKFFNPNLYNYNKFIINKSYDKNQNIDPNWFSEAKKYIEKDEYSFENDNQNKQLKVFNRKNNLNFSLEYDGFKAEPGMANIPDINSNNLSANNTINKSKNNPEWFVSLKLNGVGRTKNKNLQKFKGENFKIEKDFAAIEDDNLRINYTNNEIGLRQDFIIKNKPEGAGKPVLGLSINTKEKIIVRNKEINLISGRTGELIYCYNNLNITDKNGKNIEGCFKKVFKKRNGSTEIQIEFDDQSAEYPITIDPLSSSPNWTATGENSGDYFGFSVSSAGDVNKDGYSDVVVGAYNFSGSTGKAYVYYGSTSGLSATPNWTATGEGTGCYFGNYVFAGTSNNIYRSSNNGGNWTQLTLYNQRVRTLKVSGNYIFAGTDNYPSGVGDVFYSTNNGDIWALTALNNHYMYSLAVSGGNIFAGTESIFLSTNNGISWSQTSLNNQFGLALAVSGSNIFAGTANYTQDSGSVFLSTNNGGTWIKKNQGLNGGTGVCALLIANNYIFAGTYGKSIWRRSLTEIIGIKNISTEIPSGFSLSQNYPNPFNPVTKIKFEIPKGSPISSFGDDRVVLKVYDILGKEIQTLVNEQLQPGTYEVTFDGSELPSGTYFYQLRSGSYLETKKLVLLK